MSRRKMAIKDPFYRKIVEGLNEQSLNPTVFEHCMDDLLRDDFPGLLPVPGGSDSGWDGAIPDADGEPFPLICTVGADVIGNLTENLVAIDRGERYLKRKVALATSQQLNATRQRNLRARARTMGFKLIQIIEQQGVADRLFRNSHCCQELLGLSGRPSALSCLPPTLRPLLELKPIGRDEDLEWLEGTHEDRVLSGEPGSGKTFLFYHLIHHRAWDALFLTDTDPAAIANALREQKPSVVVVDDAHAKLDLLTKLVWIRRETNASFVILASTWPGDKDRVASILEELPSTRIRQLELLTRPEIIEVFQQTGVQAPDEVLRELVDQSARKPGLAVTIAMWWLQGLWQEIREGTVLSRNLLSAFRGLVGERAAVVLGAFAVGGDRGMGMEDVRAFLGLDWPELHRLTSGLAAGGVLSQVEDGVLAVWPRQLRWALLRSVFFPDDRPALPYRPLLDRAPNRASAVEGLIWARHRGAAVPDRVLSDLVREAGSRRAWESLAGLSPDLAQWALEHYPGDVVDIATGALKGDPLATIPRLLERTVGETRTTNSWPKHPMRILSEWVREIRQTDEILLRHRRLLAAEAKRFLDSGGDASAGAHVICLALSVDLEGHSIDPGEGRSLTISWQLVPFACVAGLATIWEEVRGAVRELDTKTWAHLKTMLWNWIYPQTASHNPNIPEATRDAMHAFAARVLCDLAPLARHSPGLIAGLQDLAGRLHVELPLEADPTFEILYPTEAKSLEDLAKWREDRYSAARSLGREWARRNPTEVASELRRYETEASRIGRRGSRMAPELCEEIATSVDNPEAWADALMAEQASPQLLRPFLTGIVKSRESLLRRCLDENGYRWLATELILESDPPIDLLDRALELAELAADLPQLVETGCLQRRVPIPTLRKLLHHPNWETALAAAVGEWCATPREEVREEVFADWRAAIFRAKKKLAAEPPVQSLQYWLGVILARDRELAFEWLFGQLAGDRLLNVEMDEPFGMAVAALDLDQRLQILKVLEEGDVPQGLPSRLVGQDADLYRKLLASEALRPFHLELLARVPDEAWIELALLALEAGYDYEAIVLASLDVPSSSWGSDVEHWSRYAEAFELLEKDQRPDAQRLARLGRDVARARVEGARTAGRAAAVKGFYG